MGLEPARLGLAIGALQWGASYETIRSTAVNKQAEKLPDDQQTGY